MCTVLGAILVETVEVLCDIDSCCCWRWTRAATFRRPAATLRWPSHATPCLCSPGRAAPRSPTTFSSLTSATNGDALLFAFVRVDSQLTLTSLLRSVFELHFNVWLEEVYRKKLWRTMKSGSVNDWFVLDYIYIEISMCSVNVFLSICSYLLWLYLHTWNIQLIEKKKNLVLLFVLLWI